MSLDQIKGVSYIVRHDDVNNFTEEISNHTACVRCRIEREEVNAALWDVSLVGTFIEEDALHILRAHCGEDYSPDFEGSKRAETLKSRIQATCESLGVPLRGGEIQCL